jgi:E3 ubiquitin-protein ligase DOA10
VYPISEIDKNAFCRICKQEDSNLISPCKCDNPILKFVHSDCLKVKKKKVEIIIKIIHFIKILKLKIN